MYKVGGLWYRFSEEDLPEVKPYLGALASFLGYEQEDGFLDRLGESRDLDLSFSLPSGYRFRANVSLTANGFLMVLRVIRSESLPLGELGFSPESLRALENLLLRRRGLLLVTGSTGSGKSTTLAAM
ncbi:ATPase, T2SS/T4P/T4SS family, partial [Thermus sp.]|uniref:ATPase, T2SS/T4P/T4SS family n=1 Tax=Thermus sp. TaxID=275 RepID=UPI002604E5DB